MSEGIMIVPFCDVIFTPCAVENVMSVPIMTALMEAQCFVLIYDWDIGWDFLEECEVGFEALS
jgi:hypothetical protein